MTENTLNLDKKAAHYAQQMVIEGCKVKKSDAKKVENLVTKTLGVLQEQGVYACMLYLFSRTGDEENIAPKLQAELYKLLDELPAFSLTEFSSSKESLKYYAETVCDNLDNLLLVKDVYEQCLIYARFTAKAMKQEE